MNRYKLLTRKEPLKVEYKSKLLIYRPHQVTPIITVADKHTLEAESQYTIAECPNWIREALERAL